MTAGPPRAAILAFHRVASPASDVHQLAVSAGVFEAELRYLQASYSIVRLSDLERPEVFHRLPSRAVALTFDDGYEDALATAVPLLDAKRIPATFFLTTAAINEEGSGFRYWWDVLEHVFLINGVTPTELHLTLTAGDRRFETGSADLRRAAHWDIVELVRMMSVAERGAVITKILAWSNTDPADVDARRLTSSEVRELAAAESHDIGAHTVNHLWLPRQPLDVQRGELERCRVELERIGGRRVSAVAYPFGAADESTAAVASSAGFTAGFIMDNGAAVAGNDPLLLPRVDAGRYRSVAELAARLTDLFEGPWPDLEDRTRAVFGRRVVTPGGADVVDENRGER